MPHWTLGKSATQDASAALVIPGSVRSASLASSPSMLYHQVFQKQGAGYGQGPISN